MAGVAEVAAERAFLRSMQIPRGFPQERMQHVLLGLCEWPPLFPLLALPQRPPRYPGSPLFFSFFFWDFCVCDFNGQIENTDKEVVVP